MLENSLQQSLFILFRCIINIETTKKLYSFLNNEDISKNPRKNNFQFIAVNNLYLYTYHFLKEEEKFCGLKTIYPKINEYIDFKQNNREHLSNLNKVKDLIIKYRNTFLGHYYRDIKGNFCLLNDIPNNSPKTAPEIFYYSDLYNSLFVVIAKIFKKELQETNIIMDNYETTIPDIEIDIEKLDKELNDFKEIIKNEYLNDK